MNDEDTRTFCGKFLYNAIASTDNAQQKNCPSSGIDVRPGRDLYMVLKRSPISQFQPKQDSDRIPFFKNRIGSDSENPLSHHLWLLVDVASLASLSCFMIRRLIGNIAFSFMFHCMSLVDGIFWICVSVPFLVMWGFIFLSLCLVKLCFSERKWL